MQPEFAPSRSTKSILRQTQSTSLTTSLKSSLSAFARCARIMVMSSRPNSIGMSKISGSGTPTSNGAHLYSMVKSNDLTVPISKSSINFSAIKATLIWRLNSTNGSPSTTLLDPTARTTARPLTKRSETSYSNNASVPRVRLGYTGYNRAACRIMRTNGHGRLLRLRRRSLPWRMGGWPIHSTHMRCRKS